VSGRQGSWFPAARAIANGGAGSGITRRWTISSVFSQHFATSGASPINGGGTIADVGESADYAPNLVPHMKILQPSARCDLLHLDPVSVMATVKRIAGFPLFAHVPVRISRSKNMWLVIVGRACFPMLARDYGTCAWRALSLRCLNLPRLVGIEKRASSDRSCFELFKVHAQNFGTGVGAPIAPIALCLIALSHVRRFCWPARSTVVSCLRDGEPAEPITLSSCATPKRGTFSKGVATLFLLPLFERRSNPPLQADRANTCSVWRLNLTHAPLRSCPRLSSGLEARH